MKRGDFDFSKILKQAQDLQQKFQEVEQELAERVVEANAGGGAVKVLANGALDIVDIKISEELLREQDKQMLEELIIVATNEALKKAKQIKQDELAKILPGMGLPPFLFP